MYLLKLQKKTHVKTTGQKAKFVDTALTYASNNSQLDTTADRHTVS